jgi:membrane associated rhomboid family serine protease
MSFLFRYFPTRFDFLVQQLDAFRQHPVGLSVTGGLGLVWGSLGVFGALGAFFLLRRRALGPAGNALIGQWFFWLVINLIFSFSVTGIAAYAHIGGLAAGLILGALLLPRGH